MTTIAWKGKTIAADTLINQSGAKAYGTKLYTTTFGMQHEHDDVSIFGWSGQRQDAFAVHHWLQNGAYRENKPPIAEAGRGLLLNSQGECFLLEDKLVFMPIVGPYAAIGSGCDYAVAFLSAGMSPYEAVSRASELDLYTGGVIEAVSIGQRTSEQRRPAQVRGLWRD